MRQRLNTPVGARREKMDMAILRDWEELVSVPGQKITMARKALAEKYQCSETRIYMGVRRALKLMGGQDHV
ncbi:MAG: hypothetical protein NC115_12015 [Bacteroidales bacterium]|nr:hypothetical protein [Bacteroidales bacterium]